MQNPRRSCLLVPPYKNSTTQLFSLRKTLPVNQDLCVGGTVLQDTRSVTHSMIVKMELMKLSAIFQPAILMSFPVCPAAVFQLPGNVMESLTAELQRMRWPVQLPVSQESSCAGRGNVFLNCMFVMDLQTVDKQMMR